MAGLVFLADFFDWTAQEAAEAYIFRSDVQYALNLEPGVDSLDSHRRTLSEDCFAMTNWPSQVFHDVTNQARRKSSNSTSPPSGSTGTHISSHVAGFTVVPEQLNVAMAMKRFFDPR